MTTPVRPPAPLRVHIDELVVVGVPVVHPHRIGPAVQAALAARLGRDGLPATRPSETPAVPPPATTVLPGTPLRPGALAELIAAAVYARLEAGR